MADKTSFEYNTTNRLLLWQWKQTIRFCPYVIIWRGVFFHLKRVIKYISSINIFKLTYVVIDTETRSKLGKNDPGRVRKVHPIRDDGRRWFIAPICWTSHISIYSFRVNRSHHITWGVTCRCWTREVFSPSVDSRLSRKFTSYEYISHS